MKHVTFLATFATAALATAACKRQPAATPPPPTNQSAIGTQNSAATAGPLTQAIDLPRGTLTFQPTRDDMTVGKAILSVYCSHPTHVRINGVQPDPAWADVHLEDGKVVVDRRNPPGTDPVWMQIDLPAVGKNQFELAPLRIESTGTAPDGLICLSVKAWFKEVTNQYDSMFYEKTDDRYALVSFCTGAPEASDVKARFKQNRVRSAIEFKEAVAKPIVIRLNQRQLRPEWAK